MTEIVLECKPDEALIRALGYSRKKITHQPDKGRVFNYLEKNPDCIGIVDEDPNAATSNHFQKFSKQGEKFDIAYYHKPNKPTRLLIIKPRLEEWILKYAKASAIDLDKFPLPKDGHHLHKIINTRIPTFEKMLREMQENNSEALKYLKQLIDGR